MRDKETVLLFPLFAVIVVLARVRIIATEEATAYAAVDYVDEGVGLDWDLVFAGYGHAGRMAQIGR